MKYYIFINYIPGGKILLIFPYKLNRNQILQLSMEVLLIISISITITVFIYLRRKKKIGLALADSPHSSLEINKKESHLNNINISKDLLKLDIDFLNENCFELFKYISTKYYVNTISFYAINNRNRLDKRVEFKDNIFIEIDSSNFDSIDIDNEVGEELKRSAILILEEGRKLILPIILKNSLIGIICITRDSRLIGVEINDMKESIQDKFNDLSENLFN